MSDIELLERSLQIVSGMLERVLTYVRAVLAGEVKGDPAVGRYLMDTLGATSENLEKSGFNASLQVRCRTFLIVVLYSSELTGHVDDIVPRQSRKIASRGVI